MRCSSRKTAAKKKNIYLCNQALSQHFDFLFVKEKAEFDNLYYRYIVDIIIIIEWLYKIKSDDNIEKLKIKVVL